MADPSHTTACLGCECERINSAPRDEKKKLVSIHRGQSIRSDDGDDDEGNKKNISTREI